MNKIELAHAIADRVGISKTQGEAVIASLVDIITETIKRDGKVVIAGFGQFSARTRAGRIGVNPQDPSKPMDIPPVKVAKFKAGAVLKKALKQSERTVPESQTEETSVLEPEELKSNEE